MENVKIVLSHLKAQRKLFLYYKCLKIQLKTLPLLYTFISVVNYIKVRENLYVSVS